MLATKQLTVAIDFHSEERNTMEVNGYRQLSGYQHYSKYLFFLFFKRRKTIKQIWNRRRVMDDRIFILAELSLYGLHVFNWSK